MAGDHLGEIGAHQNPLAVAANEPELVTVLVLGASIQFHSQCSFAGAS